jgi:hypothetical protein
LFSLIHSGYSRSCIHFTGATIHVLYIFNLFFSYARFFRYLSAAFILYTTTTNKPQHNYIIPLGDSFSDTMRQNNYKKFLALFSLWILLGSCNMKNWTADPVGPVQNIFFPIVHNFNFSVPIVQLAGPTGRQGPHSLYAFLWY